MAMLLMGCHPRLSILCKYQHHFSCLSPAAAPYQWTDGGRDLTLDPALKNANVRK